MRGNIIAILASGDTTSTQYQISYADPEFGDGRKKHETMERSTFVRFNIDLIGKIKVNQLQINGNFKGKIKVNQLQIN